MLSEQSSFYFYGGQENMKRLFEQIEWKALQAFIAVLTLPGMVIFGSITVVLFNP